MLLIEKWLEHKHGLINKSNRARLKNKDISIISSNCAGGILYHWLGLEFKSPFINLFLSNEDFLEVCESFEEFLMSEIVEDVYSSKPYPVGIINNKVRINFMHYDSFETAVRKWNERKLRLCKDNLCIMLTNWGGTRAF